MMIKQVSTDLAGRPITIEYGKLAKQANGAVTVRYGDTVVLVTAVANKEPREGIDFLPLMVDYQERFYSAGRIPGGFFKREGRPSFQATLNARLIDRPLRPLFPKNFFNDIHIVATVLSVDGDHDPAVVALLGASAALAVSPIPLQKLVGGVRIGRVGKEFICNPTAKQREESDMDIFVAGTKDAILMVEGGAKEVIEEDILEALEFGHHALQKLIHLQEELREYAPVAKMAFVSTEEDEDLRKRVESIVLPRLLEALHSPSKKERSEQISLLKSEAVTKLLDDYPAEDRTSELEARVKHSFERVLDSKARAETLAGRRVDGRTPTQIRPIQCEVGFLPRTHGSALFTRGETQALVTATLGTSEDVQRIDSMLEVGEETFMLHYNFPPFSVGEAGFLRGPGRREIGHGALAQRAIAAVVPSLEEFPYTIRLVSEILESNGSSSMASVCGSTLALMDAGVPIKAPVSGAAMGLVIEEQKVAILSDISGDEDHFGDMDFKVAGTEAGVTALQMDLKCGGISREIMRQALAQAKDARMHILGEMLKVLDAPRPQLSSYAPKIQTIQIKPEKIRDVIGPGGKMINNIISQTGVKIDVDDSGKINVAAVDSKAVDKAIQMIRDLTAEPEIGQVYAGKVKRIVDFGAFVEILPNVDGLVHISELSHHRVRYVTDILKEGDSVQVKVVAIDEEGRVKLSRKTLIAPGSEPEPAPSSAPQEGRGERGEARDRGGDRGRRDYRRGDRYDRKK
ncbi:MAG: polyribonucleotide nucleotidyltransferase [Deltaproteobacteria bacterium]|nr:polyribonucleotide nucleotidyltransferase [Deltaproteobacteria bacterium]